MTTDLKKFEEAVALEREAQTLKASGEVQKAFEAYDSAAKLYQSHGEHLKAALCFAAAATCWDIHTGWQPLQNSASRNLLAGEEAMKAKHFDYALSLFRGAAVLFEKEGDWQNYTTAILRSKCAARRRSWEIIRGHRGQSFFEAMAAPVHWRDRFVHLIQLFVNLLDNAVWGYSLRPFRVLGLMASIILASAFLYSVAGPQIVFGMKRALSFHEALYFSVVTFTTVGYGDYTALGWARVLASLEALSGIAFMPLFLISLTQRYLRAYR